MTWTDFILPPETTEKEKTRPERWFSDTGHQAARRGRPEGARRGARALWRPRRAAGAAPVTEQERDTRVDLRNLPGKVFRKG